MLPAVRRHALKSDEPVFVMSGPRVLAAQRVKSSNGKSYVLQALLPRPRFGRPAADPGRQLLGVLIVLAMSGLVCYGLVRYLTAPLVSLRAATHQLAAGDLAARTGAAQRARRDEVADLGRDFDSMAERIETLVLAQRRLLGDISHELRSPLSRLSMALALARRYVEQSAPETEINGALDRIKREAGRLNALIEQLLQLARLEGGEVKVENAPLDLEQLVHDIVTDADFEARASNRTVRVTQSGACRITGSLDLLRSAVENVGA
jgi:two-component system sensor histidine kinase CpxA